MNLFSYLYCKLLAWLSAFVADLRGVSTVEYALMVVAVIAAVALAATLLGDAFKGLFKSLSGQMTAAITT